MSVRVRLTRVGSRKNPVWRVVVADQRSPRDGRVIETVGRYNPQRQPSEIVLDRERLTHWIERGASPSDTVRRLMQADARQATSVSAAQGGATGATPGSEDPDTLAAETDGPAPAEADTPASGAAEDGTPVPPGEPSNEEGPAAAVPAADVPPGEAATAEAPDSAE